MVSLFFVLSGFILSYVYSSRLQNGKLRFLVARIVRLWPAHVVSIALLWLVAPTMFASRFTVAKLVATLTMTHAWLPFEDYWVSFVSSAWTISTEFGLYFFFLLLIYKWEQTWLWKLAGSFLCLCAVILVLEAERARLVQWSGAFWFFYLYVNPLGRLFEFTLGMATFELWRRFGPRIKNGLVAGTLWELAALAFLSFILWQAPDWADRVTRCWFFGSDLAGLWMLTSSSCFGNAALIFVLALEQGLVARLLSYPFAVLLGQLSYAIYLVHQPILHFCWTHQKDLEKIPSWVMAFIVGAVILAIAYLIWATIERPCRLLLKKLWPSPASVMTIELPASMIRSGSAISRPQGDQFVLPSRLGILIASTIVITALIFVVFCSHR